MIKSLYVFSIGSYVVADEWNANFNILNTNNIECEYAIEDAERAIAFPDEDLSILLSAVNRQPNSSEILGLTVMVAPEHEYYKTLISGEDLTIQIPQGMNSEARIALYISSERSLLPFTILYDGKTVIDYGKFDVFRAGYYFIMIYETNNVAQVKIIWTEV